MDILDRLIQLAQIQGEIHTHCLFQNHWQIEHQQSKTPQGIFHIILKGECRLILTDKILDLKTGDLFFLPKGLTHHLQNQGFKEALATVAYPIPQNSPYQEMSNGSENINLEMFCGTFFYHSPTTIIDSLPDYLHFSLQNSPLATLVKLFKNEAHTQKMAHHSVINSLSNVLFSYILRTYLANNPQTMGVLTALQDKRLNACLHAILLSPEKPWRVNKLATLANMSRANFLRVFQQKIGISPTKLLSQIRLQQAALLLKQTQRNVLNIALSVGYQSEAHFSKVFKAEYGVPPSVWRKEKNK